MTDNTPVVNEAEETDTQSNLHPKHEETLHSVYEDLNWLCRTLEENTYINTPSHLTSARDSLEVMLVEQEMIEHYFICENCGYTDWRSVKQSNAADCPNCPVQLARVKTRPTQ